MVNHFNFQLSIAVHLINQNSMFDILIDVPSISIFTWIYYIYKLYKMNDSNYNNKYTVGPTNGSGEKFTFFPKEFKLLNKMRNDWC